MQIEMYSAHWCVNCDTLKKIFNEINIEYSVIDIDTPEGADKAQANRVRGLPTVIIITDDVRVVEVGCKFKTHWLELFAGLIK